MPVALFVDILFEIISIAQRMSAVIGERVAFRQMSTEGDETMDVLSLAQLTGGLRLRELLTRVGGDRPDLALLQVASEVKAGNVSVSLAGTVGRVLVNDTELRRMTVSDIANKLRGIENQENVVVDPTERSYRLR